MDVIEIVVQKIHKVTVKTYQFLKLYYLNAINLGTNPLPTFGQPFIVQVMRAVAKYEVNSTSHLDLRQQLIEFYDDHMPDYQEPIDLRRLGTQILT